MILLPEFVIFTVGKNAFGRVECGSGRADCAVRPGSIVIMLRIGLKRAVTVWDSNQRLNE